MSSKNELISELELDIENKNVDKFAQEILNDSSFYFDEHNEQLDEENLNPAHWNQEYLVKEISLLNTNFSKERLENILIARAHLYNTKKKSSKLLKLLVVGIGIIILGFTVYKNKEQSLIIEDNSVSYKKDNTDINMTNNKVIEQNLTKNSKYKSSDINKSIATVKDINATK